MTVKDLIEFLGKQPQDIQVAYCRYSEQCLLEEKDISVEILGQARPDGWVPRLRKRYEPGKPAEIVEGQAVAQYLLFPGN